MNLPKSLIEKRIELFKEEKYTYLAVKRDEGIYKEVAKYYLFCGYDKGASDMKDYLIGLLKSDEFAFLFTHKDGNRNDIADWLEEKMR